MSSSSALDRVLVGPRVKIINYRSQLPLMSRKHNGNLSVFQIPKDQEEEYRYNQWVLERETQPEGGKMHLSDYLVIRNVGSWLPIHFNQNPGLISCKESEKDKTLIRWLPKIADENKYGKGWIEFYNYSDGTYLTAKANNDLVSSEPVHNSSQWKIVIDQEPISLKEMKYGEPTEKRIVEQTAKVLRVNNDTDTPLSVTLREELTVTVTETRSFKWEFGFKYTHSITASGGVEGLLSIESNMSAEANYVIGEEDSKTNSKEKKSEFILPVTVPPRRQSLVKVFNIQSTSTIPFIAILESGNVTWEEKGTYKGVDYGEFNVEARDNGPAVPSTRTIETL